MAALFSVTTLSGEVMNTPELLVKSFIADYEKWNHDAHQLSKNPDSDLKYLDIAEEKYKKLISKYCPPGFKHQPIAFGSDPNHEAKNEKILKIEVDGENAIVFTKHEKFMHNTDLSTEYEYHLIKAGDEWRLVSILYLIDGNKYEGL